MPIRQEGAARPIVAITGDPLPLADVLAVAQGQAEVRLSLSPHCLDRLQKAQAAVEAALAREEPVYGVSTGYGKAVENRLKQSQHEALGANLIRFHGCGTGEPVSIEAVRAAMMCRLQCFVQGCSGVSGDLLERLAAFLNAGISPVVPSEGSVGASGDLTPMSYIAAALQGDREVFYQGAIRPAAEALREANLPPYTFKLKEPLALLNGTSVMTGLAIISCSRARRLLQGSLAATALAVHAAAGQAGHFDPRIFSAKPFKGQARAAETLREWLQAQGTPPVSDHPGALQDPYSLRCAPHVLGVLWDALEWIEPWVTTEANSVNDNPLVDPDSGQILTGGNFYGGHIAFAMDGLKAALASLCDLLDRQLALLVDTRFNRGLPANLVVQEGDNRPAHHGFKAMQITASALTAEAQKATMPAAAFSRSTESHNQDKVSMGTIAARDAGRLCVLGEQVTAIHLLAAAQGARLRGHLDTRPALAALVHRVEAIVPPLTEDRRMDQDIAAIATALREGTLLEEAV